MELKRILILLSFICLGLSSFAQYQIGHQSFAFDDPARNNRNVWGEVYYPATTAGDDVPFATGDFPLVVFGHGFGIFYDEYDIWWQELVEQGYIIALPRTEGGIFPFPDHGDFGQDMAFIVDAYMAENTNATSDFFQHLSGKNAIMGHSMGGGCSYLAAGTNNANVETIISLAAADTNPSAITAGANITVPVLTIAGSLDCVVNSGGAPIDIYNGLTSTPYKAYVEITGASHCQFGKASGGSICTSGEFCGGFMSLADQHTQMFLNTVPWLDYYLKGDCARWQDFKNHLYNNNNITHTYLEAGALAVPTVALSADNLSICVGNTATLTAAISGASCGVVWELDGVVIPGETGETLNATNAGTYTATVNNADSQGNSDQLSITLAPPVSVNINSSSSNLDCNNTSIDLNAGTVFTNYAWTGGGTGQINTVSAAGTYTVTVTDNSGCTGTDMVTIIEDYAAPSTIVNTTNSMLDCNNPSAILDAGSGFTAYAWSDNSFGQTTTVTAAGNYVVTITGSNGCTAMANIMITADNTIPMVSITPSVAQLDCTNNSSLLDAGAGFASYLWSDNSTGQTTTVTTAGTYMVTVSASNGCTAMNSVTITSDGNVPQVNITADNQELTCDNIFSTLDAGTGFTNYDWSNNISGQTITVSSSGTYVVTVTASNGCTATNSIIVTENLEVPIGSISGDTDFCSGDGAFLEVSSSGMNDTYFWSTGSTDMNITVNAGGTYIVTVTGANGCTSTTDYQVAEIPYPSISFTEMAGILTADVTGGSFFTYQWYLDGSPISGATSDTHDANTTGTGDYYLEVENDGGCMDISSTQTVTIVSNNNLNANFGMEVFPTITNDIVNISLENDASLEMNIAIYDVSGKLYIHQVRYLDPDMNETLDVSTLSSGMYIMMFRSNEGTLVQKMIKE